MEDFYTLAAGRRSIRKYQDATVPREDLEYFIKSAVAAPSGCNSQCWYFVAVTNKDMIEKLAMAVADATRAFYGTSDDEAHNRYVENKCNGSTFFKNASLVIVAFMTELTFYDPRAVRAFADMGYDHGRMMEYLSYPDVLSVGAAIQNLLMAVHERGYGACWMNDPVIAGGKINTLLGIPDTYRLMSFIPIGRPAYTPREKPMKPVDEILKIID